MRQYIAEKLASRAKLGLKRGLPKPQPGLVDFCSNDYLGLSKIEVRASVQDIGATGSRLISGNTLLAEDIEQRLAAFHGHQAGLLFSSGYAANLGLFSSLSDRPITFLYDELIHASVIDGMRMGTARRHKFAHNDLGDLKRLLDRVNGEVVVAVESVYSMDGDSAPVHEILEVAANYGAAVIVDEAHSIGVFGQQGKGIAYEMSDHPALLATVLTFGKAVGYHGAIVCGSEQLKDYLVNYARSFIFSTGCSSGMLEGLVHHHEQMTLADQERSDLQALIGYYLSIATVVGFSANKGPIQYYMCPGVERVVGLSNKLRESGLDVRAIKSPTVAEGGERLRICLHAFNTNTEIDQLIQTIESWE